MYNDSPSYESESKLINNYAVAVKSNERKTPTTPVSETMDDDLTINQFSSKFNATGSAGKWTNKEDKRKTIELQDRDGAVPLKTHIYNEARVIKNKKPAN